MRATSGPAAGSATSFGYHPGLDGLRALAVAGVLLFHHGYGWAAGGYLGVSAFFTLSGFLITTLLVREHARTGGIDLKAFWGRRIRRLVPASWVTLAGVGVLAAATGIGARDLVDDVWAALANVANWRLVASGSSYEDLFSEPGLLTHYWSLAVEEQWYLVLPVVLALALRRSISTAACVVAAGLVASVAIGWTVDFDHGYYGSDTRGAELLVGVLAALIMVHPRVRFGRTGRRFVALAGAVALPVLLVTWSVTQLDPDLLRGPLALHAVATVTVVGAALVPGPVRALLGLRPLVALGRISYGVYLVHWPLFVWLTPARTGLTTHALFALRAGLTLAIATVLFRVVEHPIRARRVLTTARTAVPIAVASAVTVAATTLLVPAASSSPRDVLVVAAEAFTPPQPGPAQPAPTPTHTAEPAPRPPLRVGVFGDSTAAVAGLGLMRWADAHPGVVAISGRPRWACPVARGALVRWSDPEPIPSWCEQREQEWAEEVAQRPIDVAVLLYGAWDATDRQLPGDAWRALGDPVLDEHVAADISAANRFFLERDVKVIWLTSPQVDPAAAPWIVAGTSFPNADAARMRRFNELVTASVGAAPADVTVLDFGGWLDALPDGRPGGRLRPDGVHLTEETAVEVADQWLGPQILAAADHLIER